MFWIIIVCVCIQISEPQFIYKKHDNIIYPIVGIFQRVAETQWQAFNESVRSAYFEEKHLEPTIIYPTRTDSYSVWRELCKYKSIRPLVIFGPQGPISDGAIRDQCYLANIPHIQATWQPFDPDLELNNAKEEDEESTTEGEVLQKEETEEDKPETADTEETPTFKKITINFYPNSDELATAFAKLLKFYNWGNFAVLYEDDYGLLRIQKILAAHTSIYPVTIRRLDPLSDNNHQIFKELSMLQESRFLLDCHVDRIDKYLNIAKELHMVNHYQHYILTSLDSSILAEKMLQYHSNITWLSMMEYDILGAQHFLAPRVGKWRPNSVSPPITDFQLEALMMDDVANHILQSVNSLSTDGEDIDRPRSYVCEENVMPWSNGAKLQDMILKTQTTGVTGNVQFNETGQRVNYTLYVNEIHLSKRNTIGRWESSEPESIVIKQALLDSLNSQDTHKHFIVISRVAQPYFYEKEICKVEECAESDRYEGFSVDLVNAIFDILKEENFSYTYSFVYDKDITYGKFDTTNKKWTGLIGGLLDKKVDLVVCDLTITEERKKLVDFSVPIMSLGISILYTKDQKVTPDKFSFLNPYSFDVWMHTATAYCVVSMVLFICARISPADWENPQPCDKDPEELENIWNFKNCAWLTMGSIMTQGCDILPKAIGTRWVCGMWWFFAVIVCQTYIAQLSASMTSALAELPINNVEDLAKQNKIMYGAIDGASTLEFFKSSKDKMYRSMYETMMANPAVLVSSNDEGEKRVINGRNRYAFLMESTTIEYKMKRNCNLKKVGGELDSKDYGIAMPANSPFRSHINRAILKLKENTMLNKIKREWWEERNGAHECEKDIDENDVEGDLEMENLIGAFIVLVMGLAFALLITAAEFMDEVRNIVVREQITHKEAFIKELKASLNFFQLQKPVIRNPSRAPSIAMSENSIEERRMRRAALMENFMDVEKIQQ